MARKKQVEKYRQWLKVESIRFDTSKYSGNNMLVVDFRDRQNVLYRHYISNNKRSQVWLNQLFAGLKPVTFEELEIACFVSALATVDFKKYRDFVVGKIYEVVTVKNDGYRDKRVEIVSEIYARHIYGFNYKKVEENFENKVIFREYL